ncbi:Splicing factor 3B subunit 3 [Smittium culicis]|uniref:Splicing factor 3B subunit 3 n=1 Tax=Smittium culicis TaxID=133412 RepID=A0A1R1Y9H3_9FUNG|nr:Splicing factor 3B subunit 3 [Smittium culicis]
MHLYNSELQSTTAIEHAIVGNFSGNKEQELVLGRNDRIELWKVNPKTGKLSSIVSENVFGKVRSLIPFKLTGTIKDYIVVGSDSGAITIFEYLPAPKKFITVQQEIYGKSGFRRTVPGQYLTFDPRGRAIMISAIEKQKLVYILNRDSENNLTISSPLEANKFCSLCYDCVGVDVGYENPIFACLETNYQEIDNDPSGKALLDSEKNLVYYELDLGLNHVVRQWSSVVDARSNKIIGVPGGDDGPSGVLVCSEGFITYKSPGKNEHRVPIPRRFNPIDESERIPIIVSSVVHRMKNAFFILVQNEDGDLFKVSIDYKDSSVNSIRIKYFDTIPVANSLCIFRSGFLFCASEFGNHQFYQFENLGDEIDSPEFSSINFPSSGEYIIDSESTVYFQPHSLSCLTAVNEIESLMPTLGGMIYNIADEETPQIFALCGKNGTSASLKVIRHGLEVTEMAVSELPGNAQALWTIKQSISDESDHFIVISFLDATLVLKIGEEVEEVSDSGFVNNLPTILVQLLSDNSLVQVTPHSIRHVLQDGRVNEWKPPKNREIVCATSNSRQVVISLNRGEVVLFELDPGFSGILTEFSDRYTSQSDIVCMTIPEVEHGRIRAPVLSIGCNDQTARILSLDPSSCFDPLSTQALSDMPESMCLSKLVEHVQNKSNADQSSATSNEISSLFLFIGLRNGLLIRTTIDSSYSYEMTDTRTRFLGTRPVKLFPVTIQNKLCVLATSTRSWLNYVHQGQSKLSPMSYDMLEYSSSFSSDQCSQGVVAIAENTLRIFTIDRIDTVINQASIQLSYTPKAMTLNKDSKFFVIIESEHGIMSSSKYASLLVENGIVESLEDAQEAILPPEQFGYVRAKDGNWASCIRVLNPFTGETVQLLELDDNEAAFSLASIEFRSDLGKQYIVVGTGCNVTLRPRTSSDSYLRVYEWNEDGDKLSLLHKTKVDSVPQSLVQFQDRLAAGIGSSLVLFDLGKKKLLRKAQLNGLPSLISKLVVVPVSSAAQSSNLASQAEHAMESGMGTFIPRQKQSNRIIIADVQESIHYAIYNSYNQQFVIVCDDVIPRFITSLCCLDRDTVAVSDKFGTFTVLRLPDDLLLQLRRQSSVDNHSNAQQLLTAIANKKSVSISNKKRFNGMHEAPYKFSLVAQYHIGGSDIITFMQALPSWNQNLSVDSSSNAVDGITGDGSSKNTRPVLVYMTLLGQLGSMVPLVSLQNDVEFFTGLELNMKNEHMNYQTLPNLGYDHLMYRSKINPVKNVIDGTICEQFTSLYSPHSSGPLLATNELNGISNNSGNTGDTIRQRIAASLDRSVNEVVKKIEDIRAMNIF